MNGRLLDLLVEPVLWLIASGSGAILAALFIKKYFKIGEEAKPFILGIGMFALFFTIARTIETIRRYFGIGSYYDIIDTNFGITGLNLGFRFTYYIISYTGIAIFYFVFERNVIKTGLKKNTRYILTIFSLAEIFFTCMLYFTGAAVWAMTGVIVLFFVIAFVPIYFFLYLAKTALSREQKIAWLIVTVGFVLFVLGVMGDLPEAYMITQYIPAEFIHYGTPLLQAGGSILMGSGFAIIYKNV
ncbi:MAG: hypothetical protein HWN65_04025 [Candidatus Helarchaeota archaeon]|nr:hypothetical protein [Candidatus Helarchaeota archaeon]